jgi:hypothetical protein
MNSMVLFGLLGTSLLLFFITSKYKRLDLDEGKVDFVDIKGEDPIVN